MSQRPFRFAVGPGGLAMWPAKLPEYARRLEGLGFSALNFGDHPASPLLPPIAAMTAAALATSTLRVGIHTLGNDYRHPVVLAKELTTIDQLSGGRLEVGVGAGWFTADYETLGMTMERAGVRIERVEEAVEVFKLACAGERFSFEGDHYQITEYENFPPSVQRPHPPIMIGGGGPRVLSLAARVADVVGLNFNLHLGTMDRNDGSTGTRQATRRKVELIREAAPERFDRIELCMAVSNVAPAEEVDAVVNELAVSQQLSPQEVRDCPHFLLGDEGSIVEQIERLREEFGVSYIAVPREAVRTMEPVVRRLAGR